MKIALIGEFSGVHSALHNAFLRAGHRSVLYSTGDGFKKIGGGTHFGPKVGYGYIDLIIWLLRQGKWIKQLAKENDVVQLMNPYSLTMPSRVLRSEYQRYLLRSLSKMVIEGRSKLGLCVAGESAKVIINQNLGYRSPYKSGLIGAESSGAALLTNGNFDYEDRLYDLCATIIPFGGKAYERSARGLPAIPFPIDLDSVPYIPNVVNGKVRVLHGINRPIFKGTPLILSALKKLSVAFPDKIEVVTVTRLPLPEYLKAVAGCNVVVDQLYGDGLGMNSLFSMALGRVVISSYESDGIASIYGERAPAYEVDSEESIFEVLKEMITIWDEQKFLTVGEISRRYVEKHCDSNRISEKVIEFYGI